VCVARIALREKQSLLQQRPATERHIKHRFTLRLTTTHMRRGKHQNTRMNCRKILLTNMHKKSRWREYYTNKYIESSSSGGFHLVVSKIVTSYRVQMKYPSPMPDFIFYVSYMCHTFICCILFVWIFIWNETMTQMLVWWGSMTLEIM
jgi:hypothetical protein